MNIELTDDQVERCKLMCKAFTEVLIHETDVEVIREALRITTASLEQVLKDLRETQQ